MNRRMLPVLLTGQAMASMDGSIVAVAGPTIRRDLGAGGAALQLVLTGYLLSFAVMVVTGARMGDRYGHRRVFLAGLAGFTAASLACGLAPSASALVVARVAQGAAGALMVPQVLSLIQLQLTGAARARAIGLYSMVLALGVAGGQILGGLLVGLDLAGAQWRPAFLVNAPIGLGLLLAGRALPAGRAAARPGLDPAGVALLAAAMVALVAPLAIGRERGWPLWSWCALAAGAAGLVLFLVYEQRLAVRGRTPLVDPRVFGAQRIAAGLAACFVVMGCYAAFLFALTLHLQSGLGFTPLAAGLTFVPYAAGFATASLLLPRARRQAPLPVLGPLAFAAGAAAVAALVLAGGWPAAASVPLLAVAGAGHAAAFSPLVARLSAGVPPRHAATLSGVLSTGSLLASVLGVAALGGLYLAVAAPTAGSAVDAGAGRPAAAASGTAFAATTAAIVALLLVGAACARYAVRAGSRDPEPATECPSAPVAAGPSSPSSSPASG